MKVKHGSRRHRMKRGGGGEGIRRTEEVSPDLSDKMTVNLDTINDIPQSGGRKSRKYHRHTKKCGHVKKTQKTRKTRKHGGGVLSTAVLPFGLFGLQKYFQRNRTAKREVKRLGNKVKSGFRGVRKML